MTAEFMDKDDETILNIELDNICKSLTKMIVAYRYIRKFHMGKPGKTKRLGVGDSPSVRNEKIKDYQYEFYLESIEFDKLINSFFGIDSRKKLNRLRVDCDLEWGTIHVKQPLNPFNKVNKTSSRMIILKETIQRLRLDLGVGGSDLAYKLNLIDIAL